ncbi:MAG: hypothetical protein MI700_07720 [Balneolales bacterium]|nr:hypothetical protein [Balneolales bacterium]
MVKNNWNYFAIGLGITSIVIGLLRVFLWEIKFMDSVELFIIGLGLVAVSLANKNTKNNS